MFYDGIRMWISSISFERTDLKAKPFTIKNLNTQRERTRSSKLVLLKLSSIINCRAIEKLSVQLLSH